jgi:hypothetical protein
MAKIKPPDPTRLLHDLEHSDELGPQTVAGAELDPQLALLRVWQSGRLSRTYADLLADKHYGPACRFFLGDIYAPRDFSQRDHDIERIYAYLSRVVPAQMLQLLTDTIELNELTNQLDRALLRALIDKLGVTDTITPQLYAQSYRVCDNYADRKYQIDLTTRLLKEVAEGARLAVVGLAMKVVHGPAERAGWGELYDFLDRAYAAFKQVRDAKPFVRTIQQREMHILDQIFAGEPDPFNV